MKLTGSPKPRVKTVKTVKMKPVRNEEADD